MKNSRANISAGWSFLRRAFFIPVSLLRTSLNIIVEFIFTVVTARKVRTWQTSNHCLKFARGLRSTKKSQTSCKNHSFELSHRNRSFKLKLARGKITLQFAISSSTQNVCHLNIG
jgi:hypothetical protein